ncbi:MAG: hydrogenase maturation protease [Leptolyngbyaceae cyanobacterium bins.302]|nr:hydrogenase maturation protease [Leptolyngbyaceae cyanobacterium bins.302]
MDCHLAATLKSLHRSILVIGYGNLLRNDDGLGQEIAKQVAAWGVPDVEAIAVHQLTPELVESLTNVDVAIFIDAYPATVDQEIQVRSLEVAKSGMTSGHWCEPQVLLAMTQALYGAHPQAWWVMVPGVDFELGDSLSPIAQQGIERALQHIEHLIQSARTEPCMKLG